MARAAEQCENDIITWQEDREDNKRPSLVRPLQELKREELIIICQNLEQSLKNRDQHIDDINKHCEDLMRLYYETIETLAARNKELYLFQDQLKQYEELNRCQEQLNQRNRKADSGHSTPREEQTDYDSASLTSGNTDPELACLPNDEDDNDDTDDDDDDDVNGDDDDKDGEHNSDDDDDGEEGEDDEAEDDKDDNDDNEEGDDGNGCQDTGETRATNNRDTDQIQGDGSHLSSDYLISSATASRTTPVLSRTRTPKQNGSKKTKSGSKLSQSVLVDSLGKPARIDGHRMASKLPVPNAAARARRHSKHLATSCQNLSEKVHPVLHRRDPSKSLYDVMIAELASIHGSHTDPYVARTYDNTEIRNHPETSEVSIESWKSNSMLDSTSPPTAMKELLSDEERELRVARDGQTGYTGEVNHVFSGESSNRNVADDTTSDSEAAVKSTTNDRSEPDNIPSTDFTNQRIENDQFSLKQSRDSIGPSQPSSNSDFVVCSKSLEANPFCLRMENTLLGNSVQLPQAKPVALPRSTLSKPSMENASVTMLYKPILSNEPVYSKTSPRSNSAVGGAVSPRIRGSNSIYNLTESTLNNNDNCKSCGASLAQSVEKDSLEYTTNHASKM
ncbi:hypothetical protein LSH36_86g06078 [Paralvinella palmiformis]|uniref:Uncharacterized protein n=1 Tax=Paralvinella palmiformis TaxID=53620 RepID=A0AAD9K185_9ANNE|nr:hypothetical protein LSH36_86g06078 [Paralvinella palmiformis]